MLLKDLSYFSLSEGAQNKPQPPHSLNLSICVFLSLISRVQWNFSFVFMHTPDTINLHSYLSCYELADVIYEASTYDIGISCIISNQAEEATELSESFRSSLLIKEVRIFQKNLFSFQTTSNPYLLTWTVYSYRILGTQLARAITMYILCQETLGERTGCTGWCSNFNRITTNSSNLPCVDCFTQSSCCVRAAVKALLN